MEISEKLKHIYNYNNFVDLILDGLIHTYPIKSSIKLITRDLFKIGCQFNIDSDENTNTLFIKCISSTIYNKDIGSIFNSINLLGYFPSTFDFYDSNDIFYDSIKFQKIENKIELEEFIKKLNKKVKSSFYVRVTCESKFNRTLLVPDKLYHLTNKDNVDRILKYGLIPSKNKKAYHEDRIYLGYDKNITRNLSSQFDKKDYVLLQIDTGGLNLKIYDDPDFSGYGCYILRNIPPNKIKIIE